MADVVQAVGSQLVDQLEMGLLRGGLGDRCRVGGYIDARPFAPDLVVREPGMGAVAEGRVLGVLAGRGRPLGLRLKRSRAA